MKSEIKKKVKEKISDENYILALTDSLKMSGSGDSSLAERPKWLNQAVKEIKTIMLDCKKRIYYDMYKTYHKVGKLILSKREECDRGSVSLSHFVSVLAIEIHCSSRTLFRAAKFAEKVPILEKMPPGWDFNNVSWSRFAHGYLDRNIPFTEKRYNEVRKVRKIKFQCGHEFLVCPNCGSE